MAVGRAFEAFTQIGMGIELDNADGLGTVLARTLIGARLTVCSPPSTTGIVLSVHHCLHSFLNAPENGGDITRTVDKWRGIDSGSERLGKTVPALKLLRCFKDGARAPELFRCRRIPSVPAVRESHERGHRVLSAPSGLQFRLEKIWKFVGLQDFLLL